MDKKKKNWFLSNSAVSYDVDAAAYFTAAGITSTTEKNAWNTFVITAKAAGLWTNWQYLPFLGTTVTQKKYNAVDPRDLDAAKRLNFSGTWTYDNQGVKGNGTNTFADMNVNPSLYPAGKGFTGLYTVTNGVDGYDVGNTALGAATILITKLSDGNMYAAFGTGAFPCSVAMADARGFSVASMVDATHCEAWKNGVKVKNAVDTNVPGNLNLYLGARNNAGVADNFTSRQYSFLCTAAVNVSDANQVVLNNAVVTFLTAIGRI